FFMLRATEPIIPDRIRRAIRRSYRSGDTNLGPFGLGTILEGYQEALQTASSTTQTYVYSGVAHTDFTLQADGTYRNTTVPAFRGAVLTINGDGTRTLRYKDGRTLTFTTVVANAAVSSAQSDANGNTVTITRGYL